MENALTNYTLLPTKKMLLSATVYYVGDNHRVVQAVMLNLLVQTVGFLEHWLQLVLL
jgi:hypothetical protein